MAIVVGKKYTLLKAFKKRRALLNKNQQAAAPVHLSDSELKDLNTRILNVLFYISGRTLQSVQLNYVTCDKCFSNVIVPKYVASFTDLVRKREFKEGSLIYCSPETFQFFEIMEKLFRAAICRIPGINVEKLVDLFTTDHRLVGFTFPICHELKRKIFRRFSLFRLRIELDNVNRMNKIDEAPAAAGSKSVAQNRYTSQNPSSGWKK